MLHVVFSRHESCRFPPPPVFLIGRVRDPSPDPVPQAPGLRAGHCMKSRQNGCGAHNLHRNARDRIARHTLERKEKLPC